MFLSGAETTFSLIKPRQIQAWAHHSSGKVGVGGGGSVVVIEMFCNKKHLRKNLKKGLLVCILKCLTYQKTGYFSGDYFTDADSLRGARKITPYDQLVLMVFFIFFRLGIPEWGVSAPPPAQLDQAQGPILAHPPPRHSLFCTFYLKHVFSALHNQILNLFFSLSAYQKPDFSG